MSLSLRINAPSCNKVFLKMFPPHQITNKQGSWSWKLLQFTSRNKAFHVRKFPYCNIFIYYVLGNPWFHKKWDPVNCLVKKSFCQLAPDQCPHLSLGGPVTLRHVLLPKRFEITVDASEIWWWLLKVSRLSHYSRPGFRHPIGGMELFPSALSFNNLDETISNGY